MDFLNIFLEGKRYMFLVRGLSFSLQVTFLAAGVGVIIGMFVAILRLSNDFLSETKKFRGLSKYNPFAFLAMGYVDLIRGTPVVVQLMIINSVVFTGNLKNAPKVMIAALAFGINSGAYVAEILRSGISGLDKGQQEAARALGMPYRISMRYIILPQALKRTLPTLVSEFIILLKETSIVGYIGAQDLLRGADIIISQTYRAAPPLFTVAIIYLVLTSLFAYFMRKIERKLSLSD